MTSFGFPFLLDIGTSLWQSSPTVIAPEDGRVFGGLASRLIISNGYP
jgi:hypothetical protein